MEGAGLFFAQGQLSIRSNAATEARPMAACWTPFGGECVTLGMSTETLELCGENLAWAGKHGLWRIRGFNDWETMDTTHSRCVVEHIGAGQRGGGSIRERGL